MSEFYDTTMRRLPFWLKLHSVKVYGFLYRKNSVLDKKKMIFGKNSFISRGKKGKYRK
jgi:hypothetical protein